MPRFHFDVRDEDRVTPDEAGVELESVEAAEREAVLSTWREVGAASADIAIMSAQISRRGQYQSHRAT
jgi:hypothetical protein